MTNLFRVIILQILWYIFVKFGVSSYQFLFPLLALIVTSLDKLLFAKELSWKQYIQFSFFLLLSGFVIDSGLLYLSLIDFTGWNQMYSPYYMWSIWLIFIPYYQFAFGKFEGKYLISGICGALFAPVSYYSGSKIGNLELLSDYSVLGIGLMWGLFFPTSVWLFKKIKHQ